jgi:hypothetical protein
MAAHESIALLLAKHTLFSVSFLVVSESSRMRMSLSYSPPAATITTNRTVVVLFLVLVVVVVVVDLVFEEAAIIITTHA